MLAAFSLLLITSCSKKAPVEPVEFYSHNMFIKLDVENQSATFSDKGLIEVNKGFNYFYINETANISKFQIKTKDYDIYYLSDSTYFDADTFKIDSLNIAIEPIPKTTLIGFNCDTTGKFAYFMTYDATFDDDVEDVRFSNENVGREVDGTISEKGAYLSPSSYFYPQGKEDTINFKVLANIPLSWQSVADGNRKKEYDENGRRNQTWENPLVNDGLMFMAAPYVVLDTTIDYYRVACYFFAEDSSLMRDYLTASVDYIDMYNDMIGPYPYNSFIVAENFFPTGYGMPGWTLLGQQVIRLPFIKSTSLGHEVLHNWWGNSMFVDYERGNWCEAAAVYGADYHYKLQQSDDAAKAYRKDILKQYVSYVNDGNDFPLREFTSRTSADTRTIGYNKGMMVYHMIEEEIGSEPFWQAWKNIYKEYVKQRVSWEEWIDHFERASGEMLPHVIPQWIDRAGAPQIAVSQAKRTGTVVSFTLSDLSKDEYTLQVPVRFTGGYGVYDTTVNFDKTEFTYQLGVPEGTLAMEIDPDYNLFRKLYDDEVEPIVAAVLGYENHLYAVNDNKSMEADYLAKFASGVGDEDINIMNIVSAKTDSTSSIIFLNPSDLPDFFNEKVDEVDGIVNINGEVFDLNEHTVVLSGSEFGDCKKSMVILSKNLESLERIGQLVPHYGKYSYLVFKGARNVAKGQWEITESPLRVVL